MLWSALAGGMGWGIRGQYGHETGAMIAGLLVGLVMVRQFCPQASSLAAARTAALLTLGISVGGSMTYGQTVGLTHDAALVGNWDALRWGLLGLFVKGGIWISLGATWLAVGLGGKRYRPGELALLISVMLFLWFGGVYLLNQPYDPVGRALPRFYFSDDWRWEPDALLEPRREIWGGLLLALVGSVAYLRIGRQDRLALRLALWGFLGGGLGFSLGQCLQAFHAWNLDWFRQTPALQPLEQYVNWWNLMETTFGLIFGAVLALGVWLNRHLIELPTGSETAEVEASELPISAELALLAVHVAAVMMWSFVSFPAFDRFADQALTMILIPTVAVLAGRYWPYAVTLPVVLLPIAGKTVRELVYENSLITPRWGWIAYFVVPMVLAVAASLLFSRWQRTQRAARYAGMNLILATWTFWVLNFAFFRYPWPWEPWTTRTPNGLIFLGCALGLSWVGLRGAWQHAAAANSALESE